MAKQTKSGGITIVLPVGPKDIYLEYLPECLKSITDQMEIEDELVVVSDMSGITPDMFPVRPDLTCRIHKNEWLLGPADSWNVGIALAANEWCLMMGSDDKLLPSCLRRVRETVYKEDADPLGYYNLTCIDSNVKIEHFNNAAVVSKALWRETGGFPPSAGAGAPDALLISIMLRHMPKHLHHIAQGVPLYWVRRHEDMETLTQTVPLAEEIVSIRNKETARWKKPTWTK